MRVEVTKIVEGRREKEAKKEPHKNIFEELNDSDLPPQEKTIDRLNEEGFALILAGGDTSSLTLAYISFHLLDNPEILKELKVELSEAIPDPDRPITWQELEQLPFLVSLSLYDSLHWELTASQRACITEGLRVNAIATSRTVRVAPHETLHFKDWVIEPGVSPIIYPVHKTTY
jgi:cytochrome P450